MMKKKWNKISICMLMLALLLTGNTGSIAAAQVPVPVEKEQKKAASLFPEETSLPEVSTEPVNTSKPVVTPEPTEEPYEDISLVKIEDYTSTTLTLSWFSDGNNDGFHIYRKCKYDTAYKKLGSVSNHPFETHTFKDKNFKKGINFSYKIAAYRYDSTGKAVEGISEKKSIKIAIPKTTLSSAGRSGKKAVLKWKKVGGANGYEIYEKDGSGSYKKVKTISSGSVISYNVPDVPQQSTVSFKVRAFVKYSENYLYGSYSAVKKIQSAEKEKIVQKFKQLQKQFPTGRYWNHVGKAKYNSSTTTNKPCVHITYDDISTCNHYNCPNGILGFQCYGFAWKMSDLIYGRNAKIKNFKSFAQCGMGDVIRYKGHSVIIVEKHKNYVVVGECNYGNTCIIKWGRKVYKSELGNNATYSRRY